MVPVQSVVVVTTLYVPWAGTCPGALGTGVPAGPLSVKQTQAACVSWMIDHQGVPATYIARSPLLLTLHLSRNLMQKKTILWLKPGGCHCCQRHMH